MFNKLSDTQLELLKTVEEIVISHEQIIRQHIEMQDLHLARAEFVDFLHDMSRTLAATVASYSEQGKIFGEDELVIFLTSFATGYTRASKKYGQ